MVGGWGGWVGGGVGGWGGRHNDEKMSTTTLRIALVGATGLVGSAFLTQLAAASPALKARAGLDLALVAVANSTRTACATPPDGRLDPAAGAPALLSSSSSTSAPTSLPALATFLTSLPRPVVLVDCSSGPAVPDALYGTCLAGGVSVVTPNKAFAAGTPDAAFRAALAAGAAAGARYCGEATVGAGLPILSTLASLVDTGDSVQSVEGVFSGTLSFLFNALEADPGRPFSGIVAQARAAGYTEPDPREDLSGADVARKAVILARAAGVTGLELERDVAVDSLVPPGLGGADLSAEAFLEGLKAHDASMAARAAAAAAEGKALRFVARVDVVAGTAAVRLVSVPASGHPLSGLAGAENAFAFTTARYPASAPLVVRGPGAGAAVTAGGVFSDVLAVARGAGARV